jgi:phage gpG-like protein
MIDISINGINDLLQKLASLPDTLNAAFSTQMQSVAESLRQQVQDDELSGQALNERTGTLKNSIESAVENSSSGSTASVFVAGDVPYAAILEYGGSTKAHIIEASQGKALAFSFLGKQSFFKAVNHPGSDIAPHPYLEPALAAMQEDMMSGLEDTLSAAITS